MLKGHTPAKDKKYILYIHTCPNNKKYIGITSKENPNERWKNGKAYRTNKHFTSAILKYGWNNIKHEIVYSNLTKDEAELKEIELIKKYNANKRQFGYNIENGGSLNKEISEETRLKLIEAGKKRKHSEKTKEKMKKSHSGENNYWYGKHLPKETKEKLSELKKKKVEQFSLDGRYIKTFNSMKEASEEYNVTRQNIYACCSRRRKSACGFIWRYKNG